jgi:transcriptional antiterminator RfaH
MALSSTTERGGPTIKSNGDAVGSPVSSPTGDHVGRRASLTPRDYSRGSDVNMLRQHLIGRNGGSSLKTAGTSVASRFSLLMIRSRRELALSDEAYWFCLRTQPKHEGVAAAVLRRQFNIACFAPRLRFRKATRRGAVWFIEAMFPGYVFAEFIYKHQYRIVEHASGVHGIVHFGDNLALVDAGTISSLQTKAGDEEIVTIDPELKVGQPVTLAQPPFSGLEAVVTQVLPARERVKVLLEFLGRPVETEVATQKVLPARSRL